jgi:hypothetical protein
MASPVLEIEITEERWQRAEQSKSGGCLLADGIKEQYPNLSRVTVDMATIRATDRAKGERYTWLTPPSGQHLLLALDQGWPNPTERVKTRRPVKTTPVIRAKTGRDSVAGQKARRAERKKELEAKLAAGEELTRQEKTALARVSNPKPTPERPSSRGPVEVKVDESRGTTVHGGAPLPQGKAHPNLLRGYDRHFGAKLSDPGEVFRQAVEVAVAERLAQESPEA